MRDGDGGPVVMIVMGQAIHAGHTTEMDIRGCKREMERMCKRDGEYEIGM